MLFDLVQMDVEAQTAYLKACRNVLRVVRRVDRPEDKARIVQMLQRKINRGFCSFVSAPHLDLAVYATWFFSFDVNLQPRPKRQRPKRRAV